LRLEDRKLSASPSIEKLFAPPEGLYGSHIILCGMSAEPTVLNNILEAFTGESIDVRRAHPFVSGLLFLDSSAAPIPTSEIPGLLHLRMNAPNWESWKRQTSLLHAKVALMSFSEEKYGKKVSVFRLVVSTGNWTASSFGLSGDIDMAWSVECAPGDDTAEESDCAESFDFFKRLIAMFGFDNNPLPPLVEPWVNAWQSSFELKKRRKYKSRFVHTMDQTLLSQIENRFPEKDFGTLCIGSGFFESGESTDTPVILAALQELGRPKDRFVVVNDKRAGALASYFKEDTGEKWKPCRPLDSVAKRSSLHAKFIATIRGEKITTLYLGSGNLTIMGLKSHVKAIDSTSKRNSGNIEAGVIFEPDAQSDDWRKLLACGNDYKKKELSQFQQGDDENASLPAIAPAPILWFESTNDGLKPQWTFGCQTAECLIDSEWVQITFGDMLQESAYKLAVVQVRFDSSTPSHEIPVFGSEGIPRASLVSNLSLDEILLAISEFPHQSSSDTDDADDLDNFGGVGQASGSVEGHAVRYPLKTLMSLIESIALQNEFVTEDQFPHWIRLLRDKLCHQIDKKQIERIVALNLNPFPVLLQPGFAPENLDAIPHGRKQLEELVQDITECWNLTTASSLIETQLELVNA
jgi:hypothetical protein